MYAKVDPQRLADLVEGSGLHFKKSTNSYIFTCPKCNKKDKLYMRRSDGRFICFYCAEIEGFRGRPEYALTELLCVPVGEVKRRLYGSSGGSDSEIFLDISIKDIFGDDIPEDVQEPMPEMYPEVEFYPLDHPHAARGVKYLESRGIPADIATLYGVMYHPAARRVIFPVAYHGHLYGWQARSVAGAEPKIITSEGLKRERCVMFGDRLSGGDHALLCEGPIDAIKAHLCGGNVASMGKVVSRAQVNLLRNSGIKKLYLALDPDAAREMESLARETLDMELFLLQPSGGKKDLGDMSFEEVFEAFKTAPKISHGRLFFYIKPLPVPLHVEQAAS